MVFVTSDGRLWASSDISVGSEFLTEPPVIQYKITTLHDRFKQRSEPEYSLAKELANIHKIQIQSGKWNNKIFTNILCATGHLIDGLLTIYEREAHLLHSCCPNTLTRINEHGYLTLVAIKPITKREPITISRLNGLFGSTPFRTIRLNSLFGQSDSASSSCQCSRCNKQMDTLRSIWCPRCRGGDKKQQDESPNNNAQTKAPVCVAFKPDLQNTDIKWICLKCKEIFTSGVMPTAMESSLVGLYIKLESTMASETPSKWLAYVNYLYQTTTMVLGNGHWLSGGCNFLFSRFYASLSSNTEGETSLSYLEISLHNAWEFFKLVLRVAPDSIYSDGAPWASVLIRICLQKGHIEGFEKLCSLFLNHLKILYGSKDPTYVAYREALDLLAGRNSPVSDKQLLLQLKALSKKSHRPELKAESPSSVKDGH